MKRCWEPEMVTSVFTEIESKEYNQRLAELAEILYLHFCQHRNSNSALSGHSGPSSEAIQMKRTGTHG
jgi:hypothetical protein